MKNFEEDSYVQLVGPNGDYRFGFVLGTDEKGQHLTICMHDEADSKVAYEDAADLSNEQAPIGWRHGLSAQEFRVLELLSKEPNTTKIAQQLNLAPGTVRSYLRVLRIKLRADNRTQLVMVAQAVLKSQQGETPEE